MAPVDQPKLQTAELAHGDPLVGHPHRRRVTDGGGRVTMPMTELVDREEGGLAAPVLLDGAVQGVQPLVPLLHVPANEQKLC